MAKRGWFGDSKRHRDAAVKGARYRRSGERRWYFRVPSNFSAFGPTDPMTKKDVQEYLRREWSENGTLRGIEYWEA